VMTSSRSHLNQPYTAETDTADAVLGVQQIQHWAPHLGKDVDVYTILGARHDVFLSLPHAREEAFDITAKFLQEHIQELSTSMTHYDLTIIGAGSGNSIPTPEHDDISIAIIEKGKFGGTCMNV